MLYICTYLGFLAVRLGKSRGPGRKLEDIQMRLYAQNITSCQMFLPTRARTRKFCAPSQTGTGPCMSKEEVRRLISSFSFGDYRSQDCQECGTGTEIKINTRRRKIGNASPPRLKCTNQKHFTTKTDMSKPEHPPRMLMCTQAQVMHMLYEGST